MYSNIKNTLKSFSTLSFQKDRDHILINLGEEDAEEVLEKACNIAGIQRLSLCYVCDSVYEKIATAALEIIKDEEGSTFKVKAHRIDKSFPIPSMELAAKLGGVILHNIPSLSVDVHNPDITLKVDVKPKQTFIYCKEALGLGGYPLGMNGKVTMLLSGGIDSPVAAYSLIRRGIKVECLHFAAPPYTSDAVIDKLTDIMGVLNNYQEQIRLQVIPFTKLQMAIYANAAEPYCITIMRRMMMRIAAKAKERNHALAIATGESVGQVASQTLESLNVINEVTNIPVLRPLATSDKLSIIATSKKIGTYDISIRPYEDCCTIFTPKNPKTKPSLKDAKFYESKFDFESMIEEALDNSYFITVKDGEVIDKKMAYQKKNQDE
ncbi:MAG: tRNA 4-thiouridine(8) synthase ThiI [Bacilli bacterium]|nr:tRNA 4-thiouridine(8) synthase ThiI [Bacilli bacterium]